MADGEAVSEGGVVVAAADRPKAASISGAKRSRAGQSTTMSSSLRSVPGLASRWSRASLRTSTCRVAPKQEWNCTESSPGSSTSVGSGERFVRRSFCRRPSRVADGTLADS
jgi:hypothetical protein